MTDYVPLENLLTLFARIMPPSTAPEKRLAFIKATFITTKTFATGGNIVKLLENDTVREWELTATKIVDELANAEKSL